MVKLGILSTSKKVAIKKNRLHKTHDTTTTILSTFDIIAVIVANFAVAKRKPEKNSACTGFEPSTSAIPVCKKPRVYNEFNQFNDLLPVGLLAQ